jgi:hypothetical protein
MAGALTLWTYPLDLVRISCERCGRAGRYGRAGLIERFGADIALPDLLRRLADCDRAHDMSHPCGAHYPELGRAEGRAASGTQAPTKD